MRTNLVIGAVLLIFYVFLDDSNVKKSQIVEIMTDKPSTFIQYLMELVKGDKK